MTWLNYSESVRQLVPGLHVVHSVGDNVAFITNIGKIVDVRVTAAEVRITIENRDNRIVQFMMTPGNRLGIMSQAEAVAYRLGV